MKAGICLLLLCELCIELSMSLGNQKKHKEEYFSQNNKNPYGTIEHRSTAEPFEEQAPLEFTLYNLTEKNMNFGFNLYRKIALKHDNNVFFSPLSMSFLMAVFMLAAKGETYRQIIQGTNLHLLQGKENFHQLPALFKQLKDNITENEELVLQQGSISFVQRNFRLKEPFVNLSKQFFDMEFLSVDFHNSTHAKNVINQNIKKKTKGKIPKLFEEFDQHAKLVLVNYVLFKGKWLHPFNARFTELETFHIDKFRNVQVPMMFKSDKVASTLDKNLGCIVLKLPFSGSAHMLVAMPEKEGDYGSLEDHITAELMESWLRNMETRKMDVIFPKFKLDQKYQMHELLRGLGIKNLFTNKADLSQLTDQRFVKVSQIIQRAVIEVDEKGTEAASVSGSEIIAYSMPPTVKVNRPFLFIIYEETFKTLLFMGRVVNPTEM
ncbi:protein Z-dependent protease inhibitor [Pelodiscus sinensis]|nr:protein Z-dependent protease inhibitor [Pelodiscus sinensis]|eukprot:XP_006133743.1 protein Z-dependent protease inhibitor [Pelodiscus sinensis]